MLEMKLEVRGEQVFLPLADSICRHLGLTEEDEEVEILMLSDGIIVVRRPFNISGDKASID